MDPVHQRDGSWCFWDEVWSNEYGPYDTEEEARLKLEEYVKTL